METQVNAALRELGLDASTPPPDTATWQAFLERVKEPKRNDEETSPSVKAVHDISGGTQFAAEEWPHLVMFHPEPILVSVDDTIVYMNEAGAQLFGVRSPQAILGKSIFDFVAPEYHATIYARKSKIEAGKWTEPFEHRMIRGDGGERYVQTYSRPITYGGQPAAYTVVHDVTARREAEQALRESEARFRKMFERHSAPMFLIDPDSGHIEDANRSAANFYGYGEEALRSMHIQDINVLPAEEVRNRREKARERERNRFTFLHRLSDGSIRTVEVHSTPIQTQEKTLLFSIIHDITKRREVENQLRRRANLETLIVQLSTQFINTPAEDVDAGIEEALEAIGSFIGADRSYVFLLRGDGPVQEQMMDNTHEWSARGIESQKAQLQGIPCAAVPWWIAQLAQLEPLDIPKVADLPSEAEATREILEEQDIDALVAVPMVWEGTLIGFVGFDVVRPGTQLPDNAATLLQVVGDILVNAIKQRETELALRESEARFRILAEHATDVITRTDADGRFSYVSPAVRDVLGYEPEELVGTDPSALVHPDDRARVEDAQQRILEGTPSKVEYRARTKDGRYRWVEGTGQGVFDPQTGRVKSIVTAARDITERKATEQALRQGVGHGAPDESRSSHDADPHVSSSRVPDASCRVRCTSNIRRPRPPTGRAGVAADARVRVQPTSTSIFLERASSAFGTWTRRIPFSMRASTSSALTLRGSRKRRSKRPSARSRRRKLFPSVVSSRRPLMLSVPSSRETWMSSRLKPGSSDSTT